MPVFVLNNLTYDINFNRSSLLPVVVKERNFESDVLRKANQFLSFKSGNVQLLDVLKNLGAGANLDSFLKAYKIAEIKGIYTKGETTQLNWT